MRRGDREASAEFLMAYGPLIRRRFRSRLGRALRQVFDTDDLFSTIARRLDEIVLARRLTASTIDELWSLIGKIAHNKLADQALIAERDRRVVRRIVEQRPTPPGDPAEVLDRREEARRVLSWSTGQLRAMDRDFLLLRLASRTCGEIARLLGMAAPSARKRWLRIKGTLSARRRVVDERAEQASPPPPPHAAR